MAGDFNKPALADNYTAFAQSVRDIVSDMIKGLDPALSLGTANVPANAIRWSSSSKRWEKFNGTAWAALSSDYAITITGTAAGWTTSRTLSLTGAVTGSGGWDGSGNLSIATTLATVAVNKGGTNLTSYTVGDMIYASGTTTLAKLAAVATGNVMLAGGVGAAPSWGKVGLATHVSGTLPVANGGTGVATLSGLAWGSGTSAFAAATADQVVGVIGSTAVAKAADWTNKPADATQAEMETGEEAANRMMSPLRVAQAVAALATAGVPKLASDPVSPVNGDVWANTTVGALRGALAVAGIWWNAAGTALAGRIYGAGAGAVSAALIFGANDAGGAGATSESYNGTSWASGGSLATARTQLAGCGATSSAALSVCGANGSGTAVGTTEAYNGTSWATGGNATTLSLTAACGTTTAALRSGGYNNTPANVNSTQSYNGTAWSSGGNLPAAKRALAMCGTTSAALNSGGYDNSGGTAACATYNGTAWSAVSSLPAANYYHTMSGTTASALTAGGAASAGMSYLYNGSAWASTGSMASARSSHSGAGSSSSAALACCGTDAGGASVESYNGAQATRVVEFSKSFVY